MFAEHQSQISTYVAQTGAHGFRRVASFALLSAHVPFASVARAFAVGEKIGYRAAMNSGHAQVINETRLTRLSLLASTADSHWRELSLMRAASGDFVNDALAYLVRNVPGLGLVKAGFTLQMAFGESGCIDTHNARRLGLSRHAFHWQASKSARATAGLARRYNATVEDLGGCGQLWDDWCQLISARYPDRWPSATDVSAVHLCVVD